MAANGIPQDRRRFPKGHWGKYKGVTCSVEGCENAARARGMCNSHYNKHRWATGVRPPSVNPRSRRAAHLRHRYGIELSDYERVFTEQGGVCAICKQPPTNKNSPKHWKKIFCVDHCHN